MRFFTLEESNEILRDILPELERARVIYREILSYRREMRRVIEAANKNGGGGMVDGIHYLDLIQELAKLTDKFSAKGVQIKDFSRGLINLPSIRDGRAVFLCWQFGDGEEIRFWHENKAGFAARKPL